MNIIQRVFKYALNNNYIIFIRYLPSNFKTTFIKNNNLNNNTVTSFFLFIFFILSF